MDWELKMFVKIKLYRILEANKAVTAEIEEQKKNQIVLSDELAMTIRFQFFEFF